MTSRKTGEETGELPFDQPENKAVKKTAKKTRKKTTSRGRRKKDNYTRPLMILLIMGLCTAVLILSSLLLQRGGITVQPKVESDHSSVKQSQKADIPKEKEQPVQKAVDTAPKDEAQETLEAIVSVLYYIYYDEDSDSLSYRGVKAEVPAENPYISTLRKLIASKPSSLETSLPSTIRVNSVRVADGVAYIDLSSEFAEGAYGDIAPARVNQILLTMTQFEDISGITLSVNGSIIETMADGRHYSWPLRRRL